jgi:hypothetical protein
MRTTTLAACVALVALAGLNWTPAENVKAVTAWPPNVFAIGTFKGVVGNFSTTQNVDTIQAAVNAAESWAARNTPTTGPDKGIAPDTYVLLAPGDYKTDAYENPQPEPGQDSAAITITGANVWLIGMNRNSVIIDGTKSGPPCSTSPSDQVYGPPVNGQNGLEPSNASNGEGFNGVMVWQAAGTWVQNLTVCNCLDGTGGDGGAGNEIWWNGGADGGKVFPDYQGGYVGQYMTATSTYFNPNDAQGGEQTAATYGIFSSDWSGGVWDKTYASNFNDSGYYIGACQDECDQEVDQAWAEHNALGYSGSNSGGWLWVHNSRFDDNEDGFDTNSQNGDNPPPQNGSCNPNDLNPDRNYTVSPPVPAVPAGICWVFSNNISEDNNDPNVPTYGSAAAGPVGTGMSLSGARDDAVVDNTFEHDDAWGDILVPYPDSGPPCTGGTQLQAACLFDEYGDAAIGNKYLDNGSYGNPTNGDIAAVNTEPGPTDCFSSNSDLAGDLTTSPPDIETLYPKCTGSTVPPDANALFADEAACDSDSISIGPVTGGAICPPGSNYPRQTAVTMRPLPGATAGTYTGPGPYQGPVSALENPTSSSLPSMPNPCAGLRGGNGAPANPWCPNG